jgi:hypothetical protein
MNSAIINNPADLFAMITRISRSTPDTRDTELATSAFLAVIGAVNLTPRV